MIYTRHKRRLVPPEGGWGWMIAIAVCLCFFIIFPIAQSFGLLYKDIFKELGFTGTQIAMILNTNLAFSNLSGIINGPLIKHYGYRTSSFAGGACIIVGLIFTAYSTQFEHFLVAYGLITSLGFGMAMQSFPVALNSYFLKKRSKINGYVSAFYGLGPILMPQFISYLLTEYDVKSIMIILAALSGNMLVAAALLQPVEWHLVPEKEEEINNYENEETEFLDRKLESGTSRRLSTMLTDSMTSLHAVSRVSVSEQTASICPEAGSEGSDYSGKPREKKTLLKRILKAISKTFDLDLLKDLVFVNIVIGLSLDFFAEINFLLLIPFIMTDYNLSTERTATFMSTFAIADIIFRFLAPYVRDILKYSQRVMLIICLVLLMLARSTLLITYNFIPLLFCAAAIGAARGGRLVYWTLVVPGHVPIDKLPAALGLQFTISGMLIMLGGPVIGILRDYAGNYRMCIYFINFITAIGISFWTVEFLCRRCKSKRHLKNVVINNCDI